MKNTLKQRKAIADALAREWPADAPGTRCWHAVYVMPEGETRVAQLYQVRGGGGVEVGCVRDMEHGQLRSPVLTTLEAVVWLGLHRLAYEVDWVQTL